MLLEHALELFVVEVGGQVFDEDVALIQVGTVLRLMGLVRGGR